MIISIEEKLRNLKKLNSENYKKLVSEYGIQTVNQAIENIIDKEEGIDSFDKFSYYFSKCVDNCEFGEINAVNLYLNDMNLTLHMTSEETKKNTIELHNIVLKLEKLFMEIGCYARKQWISEKVSICLEECNNSEKLKRLKQLYNEFLIKRNLVVEGNLGLVIRFAKIFFNKKLGMPFEEYIQYGNVGLMKAAEKYSPNYDASFATYAYYWIRSEMVRDTSRDIYSYYIPDYLLADNRSRVIATEELTKKLGEIPTDDEVAKYMNVPVKKITTLKQICSHAFSLDDKLRIGNENDTNLLFIDTFASEEPSTEEVFFKNTMIEDLNNSMQKYLNDRELYILKCRFGLEDGFVHTLEDLGKNLGLTRQRVEQIEKSAKRKLKTKCKYLADYLK